MAKETKKDVQEFVDKTIKKGSMVNTDGSPSLRDLKNVDADYQVTGTSQEAINHWLPWVHKFISNAKSWIVGTHHGVESNTSVSIYPSTHIDLIAAMTQTPCSSERSELVLTLSLKRHRYFSDKHL